MKAALAFIFLAAASFAADVTGTWYFAVELSVGSGAPTFVLKQDGTKLTGTYSGTLGEVPVKGKVTGDDIEIDFEAETAGEKFKVVYTGKIKSASEMAGKVVYGQIGDGTWTAKKKE
jgi:hypothetical protein